ncbi:L,D-transpeptidase [Bacillus sp. MKU004]|jgi:lipoprotein-anchoring transpeptidase ErfK/SrfK|uniref:L,D-transpeptidase n=1 Tax=[Bacillus] enclensis TaxID=1402860 RepID=UPI000509F416|nr:L,D-transpeptidase [[Bacillus] enclensis]MBH9968391.1 L,D-transpeptidase [[Bacillus] enclensis]OAT84130.1 L,D-transpeptidase [Bacillus sp. MKU004]QTC43893.1 L,D-transpeptidase [Bacillus sp. V3]QWC21596.1 L,D-transpeptidase [Bacillus haikouensis]
MRILLAILLMASPIWPLGRNPLPGDPFLIVNKENNQLAFINEGKIAGTYGVATGKTTELTPEGLFTVTVKAKNPYYRKKNIPGGDPRNPLGSRWIGFDAKGTDGRIYGVHGTNRPSSIGKYISNGCIRMLNKNVEFIYDRVPVGTKILVVKSPKTFQQLGEEYGALK